MSEGSEATLFGCGGVGNAVAGTSPGRAVHDEDVENPAVDMLSPVYRVSWSERRLPYEHQVGAAGVGRVEDGQCAQDSGPHLFPTHGRTRLCI